MLYNNKTFCYWLQGYFELTAQAILTPKRVAKIEHKLEKIIEPKGPFTNWLYDVVFLLKKQKYPMSLINFFQPMIIHELGLVFQHDIDNSYATEMTPEELHHIHHGTRPKE